jgi:DUF1680 family protein
VARALLSWTGAVKYADFLERVLHNGILGTQRGYVPGVMLYNLPLGAGVSKAGKQHWRASGWGEPLASFWCCYGTLVESFAKCVGPPHLHSRAASTDGIHLVLG